MKIDGFCEDRLRGAGNFSNMVTSEDMQSSENALCSSARTLSVAAVVASRRPPRWVGDALARVDKLDGVHLEHVIVDPQTDEPRYAPGVPTILKLYSYADSRAYPLPSSGLDERPLPEKLDRLVANDASQITVDYMVDLRTNGDARRWAGHARLGVLSPRNELVQPAERNVLDAIRNLSPIASNVELVDATGARVVTETIGACHVLSPGRTLETAYRRSEILVPRALERLAGSRIGEMERSSESRVSLTAPPSLRSALAFLLSAVPRLAGRFCRHLVMKEEWYVAARVLPEGEEPLPWNLGSSRRFERVQAPRSVYLADPWLLERDGCTYVFVESFAHREGRGTIVVAPVDSHGRFADVRPALQRPYHLSYPCIFEFEGELFMIPESSANGTVDLYRSSAFPAGWDHVGVLLRDVLGADPTVLAHEGLLWLFVAIAGSGHLSADEELFLYFSERPEGPWTPHPLNPVVADVRCARPAGAIFEHAGKLVRPAQDCLRGYGHGISIRSIDRISRDAFEEHELGRITADQLEVDGTDVHTYTCAGQFEMIDVRRLRLRA